MSDLQEYQRRLLDFLKALDEAQKTLSNLRNEAMELFMFTQDKEFEQ